MTDVVPGSGDGAPPFAATVRLNNPAYVDPTVRIFGDVVAEEGTSFWPYAVIRAEKHGVRIGKKCNIQDHVMLHIGVNTPTVIGDYCSITHRVVIHGAEIGDNTLVGIGAILMDGVKVGRNCVIAGGSFLPENSVIPDNSVVMGLPGKVVATRNNLQQCHRNALIYYYNALAYAQGKHDAWSDETLMRQVSADAQKAAADPK